jgi:O-antigen/teichoic acid export membrane protein
VPDQSSRLSRKPQDLVLSAMLGFLIVSSITLYSSVIILAGPFQEPVVTPMFVLGIVGFALFGVPLLVVYRDETTRMETRIDSSIWRLAEETTLLSGFFLLLVVWVFLGFRGNPGFELLHPYSILLAIVGSLLSFAGFLSWTERRRNLL